MVAVPPDTPVTTPETEPTVATDRLPLYHSPPEIRSLKEMVVPAHSEEGPLTGPGVGLTVTITVAGQPVEII
jgi:hypothetical protein